MSLLGRNGVGRSTTIKSIMGEVAPRGRSRSRAREIAGLRARTRSPASASATCRRTATSFPASPCARTSILGMKRSRRAGAGRSRTCSSSFPARRARRHAGRRPLRRRAADADDLPHADGRPRPHHDRRADRGPGAEARRAGGATSSRDRAPRHRDPPRRAEADDRARRSARRLYVMGHGSIVFEGTPPTSAPTTPCARSGWRSRKWCLTPFSPADLGEGSRRRRGGRRR